MTPSHKKQIDELIAALSVGLRADKKNWRAHECNRIATLACNSREAIKAMRDENEALREALEAVKCEVVQSDANNLENNCLGTGLPENANLSPETRILCEQALENGGK